MEDWKDIPGYEGRYQISSARRVRSLRKTGNHKIKAISNYRGQDVVYLSTGKKSVRMYIDYLMSQAFGDSGTIDMNQSATFLDHNSRSDLTECLLAALSEIGPVLNLDSAKDLAAIRFQFNNALTAFAEGNTKGVLI